MNNWGLIVYFPINRLTWKTKVIKCPKCHSDNLGKKRKGLEDRHTEYGWELTYKETYICKNCGHQFGESTFMEGKDFRNDTRYGNSFGLETPNTVFGVFLAAISVALLAILMITVISFA